jgi:DNA replication protein DnaC
LPQPNRSATALKWHYGISGLVLWGVKASGKSRTASLIIEREVNAGRRVVALGSGGFKAGCEEREWKRGRWLKALGRVDILFVDDIDKMSLTNNQEADFFAVLNDRMGRLPTLVTGNTRGAELETRFRLGGVLVDRIRRYCYSVHFGELDSK